MTFFQFSEFSEILPCNHHTVPVVLVQVSRLMDFRVDVASRVPIYRQLRDQIRKQIALGRLQPEDQLPSVRELSRTLVVNPNTIARVYTELEREGVLNTRPGLGVFVATPSSDLTKKSRREKLHELLDTFLTDAVHLGMSHDEVLRAVEERSKKFHWPDP